MIFPSANVLYRGSLLYNGARVEFGKTEKIDEIEVNITTEDNKNGYYVLPRIKNTGERNSGQISKIRSLDIVLPFTSFRYNTLKGDNSSKDTFFPIEKEFCEGDSLELQPKGGRSSDEAFPFFSVSIGGETMLIAIGWTGQWVYSIDVDSGGAHIQIGLPEADFYLKPGEEVRLPSVLIIEDEDSNKPYFRLKQFFKDKLSSFQPADKPLPLSMSPFDFYFWDNKSHPMFSEEGQKKIVDIMNLCDGYDTLWLDAGWFKGVENFPAGVGNYSPRASFPNGLAPVAEYAHKNGYRFLLWFEPERVCADTEIAADHPEFMLRVPEDGYTLLYDMSNPDAVDYLKTLIVNFLRDNKVDIFRMDFNCWPLGFFRANDEEGRKGLVEIKYIQGLYDFWDGLHEEIPDLFIDNCASGGRRIDLETCMRTIPLWRSDLSCNAETSENRTTVWMQNGALTLSRYIPYHHAGIRGTIAYLARCAYTSGVVTAFPVFDDDFDPAKAHMVLSEINRLRKYWLGDFYPITAPTLDESVWAAFRLETGNSGAIFCFRRDLCDEPNFVISAPNALDCDYTVIFCDEFYNLTTETIPGEKLRQGIVVTIPSPRQSLTVEYFPGK